MYKNISEIDFDVVGTCNLQCSYCYLQTGDQHRNINRSLSKETVDNFLSSYSEQHPGSEKITLTFLGGEPLIRFDIIEYIVNEFNRSLGDRHTLIYRIATNGTLINKHIVDFCKKNDIFLQVTLDGKECTHNVQRRFKNGQGSFSRITENIKLLKDQNVDFQIRVNLTANSDLPSDIINYYRSISLLDGDENKISFGIVTPGSGNNEDNLSPENISEIAEDLVHIYKESERSAENYTISNLDKIINNFFSAEIATCGISRNRAAVSFDGFIYPCHRFTRSDDHAVGRISEGEQVDITHGSIDAAKYYKECCGKCEYVFLCDVFCAHEYFFSKGDPSKRYLCRFNKELIPRVLDALIRHELSGRLINKQEQDLTVQYIDNYTQKKHMSSAKKIKRCPSAKRIDLGEDGVLYNERKKYIANTMTMSIWDLIDGHRTARQITQEIADVCEVEFETIKDDIYGQLAAFRELGLAEEATGADNA